MTSPKTNRYKQKPGGGRFAALVLLVVILAVAGYAVFEHLIQTNNPPVPPVPSVQQPSAIPSQLPVNPDEGLGQPKTDQTSQGVATSSKDDTPPANSRDKKFLAIIIDDMGTNMQEARALADIGVPITFSIIPGLRSYREVAAFAASSNIETMIHIPMQAKGWPQRRLEPNGLLVSMEDADIRAHIEGFLRDIPGAVGANNHMGSEYTEHEDKMRPVLEALKGRGLFFIDSVTSSRTVGQRMAREMSIKSARRHVFLDNEQNPAYILNQLSQALALAKKNGGAIAICHPHPATIKALASALPDLERQGITLVAASSLVK